MLAILNYTGLAIVAMLCIGLYGVKYETREARADLAGLERALAEEVEQIRVMRAEWTLLNEPDRLERLARKFLDLRPLESAQVATYADLPPMLGRELHPLPRAGGPAVMPAAFEAQGALGSGEIVLLPMDGPAEGVEVVWRR